MRRAQRGPFLDEGMAFTTVREFSCCRKSHMNQAA
jgi:hypothetical protein